MKIRLAFILILVTALDMASFPFCKNRYRREEDKPSITIEYEYTNEEEPRYNYHQYGRILGANPSGTITLEDIKHAKVRAFPSYLKVVGYALYNQNEDTFTDIEFPFEYNLDNVIGYYNGFYDTIFIKAKLEFVES